MIRRLACASALLSFALFGCSGEPLDSAPEHVDVESNPIINGTLDTTHQAVVALFGTQSACTATIVAVSGNFGFALTAAHCVTLDTPQQIAQCNDYNNPASCIVYNVVDFAAHPGYNQQVYDFGMVKFTGAGGATPIIPAMQAAEDNLNLGDTVNIIGYGLTQNGPTTKRYHRNMVIDQDLTALLMVYGQQQGGPCNGDSGGPAISVVGGQERVSGVTSFGDQNCNQFGASGRVSAVYGTFIKPFIDGGVVGMQTCDQCIEAATTGVGGCINQVNACFNNADCSAMVNCFNGCAANDQACIQACANAHPAGIPIYNAIFDCVCDTACMTECGAEAFCQGGSSSSTATTANVAASSTTTSSATGDAAAGPTTGVGGASATGADGSVGVGGATSTSTGGTTKKKHKATPDAEEDSGCGCRIPGGAGTSNEGLALLGVALGAAAIGRRRRRS